MTRRLAAALGFSAAFLLQYRFLTAPLYGYWGFSNVTGAECLWLAPVMALPALALPARLDRPSRLFALLQYALLYAPCCVLVPHSTRAPLEPARAWAIVAGLGLATVFLGVLASRPAPRPWAAPVALRRGALLGWAWALALACLGLALAVSRPQAVDLMHTALARAAYSAATARLGPWFRYLDAWVGLALVPLLLAESLRRRSVAAAALLGVLCVGMFLLSGRKTELFCPLAVGLAFVAVRSGVDLDGALVALAAALMLPLGLKAAGWSRALGFYANVVDFRVFAVPQVLVAQYDAYAATHGWTLFRHVGLVNRLFFRGAPFTQPYAAVAAFYYHARFTADAMPYATDGLAALGLAGLPLVALLLGATFLGLDKAAARHPAELVLPAMLPFLFSLCNNSLFTSLLTGGGLVLALAFWLLPAAEPPA